MKEKPQTRADKIEIKYSSEHWTLLKQFREKTLTVISPLHEHHIPAIIHGSVARGDVSKDSDVDIFIPEPPSSFQVENALEQSGFSICSRGVIQATPLYAMKAYIEIDAATTVSFPLMSMRRVEREFYRFSGQVSIDQLRSDTRVAGVDKRLMLIHPIQTGHLERSIVGYEEEAAQDLGIAVETVQDRVRTLTKRDTTGRTGVFLKRELDQGETFELILKRLAEENPAVRRRLRR